MKWFRHYADASTHDALVTQIEDEFGLEGYARFLKLLEAVVQSMESKNDDPVFKTSWKRINQILGCKRRKAEEFLDYLENISQTKIKKAEKMVSITMPWLPDLLDKNASSSKTRQASVEPREENIKLIRNTDVEKSKLDNNKTSEEESQIFDDAAPLDEIPF